MAYRGNLREPGICSKERFDKLHGESLALLAHSKKIKLCSDEQQQVSATLLIRLKNILRKQVKTNHISSEKAGKMTF